MLIENIYCNWSGGCAIGSLGTGTRIPFTSHLLNPLLTHPEISNIIYRNVYTQQSNQMLMIKSNGGSGTVKNCSFSNFLGHTNAYSLDLNAYWSSQKTASGSGVQYTGLTFSNFKGTCSNGVQRAPMNIICPSAVPCKGIVVDGFAVWTESGSSVLWKCENAQGQGGCLAGNGNAVASVTSTIKSAP